MGYGDWEMGDFCSEHGRLCQDMEGDCDGDHECEGSLKCGTDNCDWPQHASWHDEVDCCYSDAGKYNFS